MPEIPGSDAIVVGSGPNGLAAAIELARAGLSVAVVEARDEPGGGTRSAELTLPGFVHDVCSAVHPLAAGSPFFAGLPLAGRGLDWIHPPIPLAHPLDDGTAAVLDRSVEETARCLGADGPAYARLLGPFAAAWPALAEGILGPLHWPAAPVLFARFGLAAARSARGLARSAFGGEPARALFAGLAAHSFLPLDAIASAASGIVLAVLGHAVGWPFPRGGARRIAEALVACLADLGGKVVAGVEVRSLGDLPRSLAVLLDVTPRQLLGIAGRYLPRLRRLRLGRYRYGPGAFKVDWALDGPIPWRAPECGRAGTVHLGGGLEEIAAGERAVARGRLPERPFVIVAQPSLFDPTRAPPGRHTAWAYCHVPNGSPADMTGRIEAQIERFAPGFRDRVLARHALGPRDLERGNANLVGGDINGGAQDALQIVARPVLSRDPYAAGAPGLFLCSSSTPPGGGVHGMCGFHAARSALRFLRASSTGGR